MKTFGCYTLQKTKKQKKNSKKLTNRDRFYNTKTVGKQYELKYKQKNRNFFFGVKKRNTKKKKIK